MHTGKFARNLILLTKCGHEKFMMEHKSSSGLLKLKLKRLSVDSGSKREEEYVGNVFKELDSLLHTVCHKHDGSVSQKECHRIIDVWPMAERTLAKLHESIYRRLRATPTTTSPWFCSFNREIPKEVFQIVWKEIIQHNSFGHSAMETAACIRIDITDRRKAVYVFHRMNDEGILVEKEKLLKREFPDRSVAEVLASREHPFGLKYSKNSEILVVKFNYGFWNSYGVPQH